MPVEDTKVLTRNTDDFIIGDRVWVGGSKPGHIQYIGETQFAPGEWAGVVLDDAIGKNDGCVAGVRYFMCEPKRGVFSRLEKLSRFPIGSAAIAAANAAAAAATGRVTPCSSEDSRGNGSVRSASPTLRASTLASAAKVVTPRSSTPTSVSGESVNGKLRVGDRVHVSSVNGVKLGTLRYLGATDFAGGEWAGVELDQPTGKNDGSVSGKRYFSCVLKYGLFAPIHKVSRAGGPRASPPPLSRLSPSPLKSRTQGSYESLTVSSDRSNKVRLGVTSLTPTMPENENFHDSTSQLSDFSGTGDFGRSEQTERSFEDEELILKYQDEIESLRSQLQEANGQLSNLSFEELLKQQAEHIQQLQKELDAERSEVARATVHVDETERQLSNVQAAHEQYKLDAEQHLAEAKQYVADVHKKLVVLKETKVQVEQQLEDEKRKLEDLQFRCEEAEILSSGSEKEKELLEAKNRQLSELLAAEQERADQLEKESSKGFLAEEDLVTSLTAEIEALRSQLHDAEQRVQENNKQQLEKSVLIAQITELQNSTSAKDTDINALKGKISELSHTLNTERNNLSQQVQELTDELENVAKQQIATVQSLQAEMANTQFVNGDLARKVEMLESQCQQLTTQKAKLESDIADTLKMSGDSSAQLSRLNEDIRDKERECEKLRAELLSVNQTLASAKLTLNDNSEKFGTQMSQAAEEIQVLTNSLQSQKAQYEDSIWQLREQLVNEQTGNEAAKVSLLSENGELKNQCAYLQSELQRLTSELKNSASDQDEVQEQVANLSEEINKEREHRTAVERELREVQASLQTSQEAAAHERQQLESAVRNKDNAATVLQSEIEQLRNKFASHEEMLRQKLMENKSETLRLEAMKSEWTEQINELMKERNELVKQLEDAHLSSDLQVHQYAGRCSDLEHQLSVLQQREADLLTNLDNERASIRAEEASLRLMLEKRDAELRRLQSELSTSRSDSLQVSQLQANLQKTQHEKSTLETEKKSLENKVVELQVRVAESAVNANTIDPKLSRLLEDKEAGETQIEFLNSVIVDMQRKNDELQARIQIMETGELPDINLNGIKPNIVPPRLYCDICEIFDQHDTEDCPKQTASDSECSHNHGERGEKRPYCDNCEVFGHWTETCDDNETF